MSNILFVEGAIRKYIQKTCFCEDSHPTDKMKIEGSTMVNDKITYVTALYMDICNICEKPYKVWYDGGNCILVKNVGD